MNGDRCQNLIKHIEAARKETDEILKELKGKPGGKNFANAAKELQIAWWWARQGADEIRR